MYTVKLLSYNRESITHCRKNKSKADKTITVFIIKLNKLLQTCLEEINYSFKQQINILSLVQFFIYPVREYLLFIESFGRQQFQCCYYISFMLSSMMS